MTSEGGCSSRSVRFTCTTFLSCCFAALIYSDGRGCPSCIMCIFISTLERLVFSRRNDEKKCIMFIAFLLLCCRRSRTARCGRVMKMNKT